MAKHIGQVNTLLILAFPLLDITFLLCWLEIAIRICA
jgi:hypothetical protein